jgi:hypothetical protein
MTQSIASTTWVALNRSRIFFLCELVLFNCFSGCAGYQGGFGAVRS